MKRTRNVQRFGTTALACLLAGQVLAQQQSPLIREGTTFNLGGRQAIVKALEGLPYVESEYTKRFRFDAWTNPKLKELRERYRLEEVVAPGKDEFEKQ